MAGGAGEHDRLDSSQHQAVVHADGPLIVLAGPGTGKTRVIVHRVARIIRAGTDPRSVVALTFTNKAAAELRTRLASILGAAVADSVSAGTIHSFADGLVRRFGDLAGFRARRVLVDSARRRRLMGELVLRHNLYPDLVSQGREAILDQAARTIEQLQCAGVFSDRAEAFARDWTERAARADGDAERLAAERARASLFAQHARLYALVDAACRERGWYAYGDMVMQAIRVLRDSADAAALARDAFRHVVVDEFQDVDRGQIELLRLLCPPAKNPDLCVVGDDDQSIYAFRGADDRAFARFARLWPEHREVRLGWNHRSGRAIVALANAVMARASIRFAPDKRTEVAPRRESAPPDADARVEVVEYKALEDEADAVAAMILADRRLNPGRPLREYAVIARTHADVDRIAGALAVEGVPARVTRGESLLDDAGVQGVLKWMDVLCDPGAVPAALWLLTRPPFDVTVEAAAELARLWRAESSRHGAEEPGGGTTLTFIPWLAGRVGASHGIERFCRVHAELADAALRLPAYDAVLAVVRAGQLAYADLPAERDKAKRIGRLAELLRFVRDRAPLLDAPGGLAALRDDYNSLDEREREFRADEADRFAEPEPDDETPDAVALLTAHGAKGREFDTVFVVRAYPAGRSGFPSTQLPDEQLPPELAGDEADRLDPRERHLAEERRLFYVACTRARRRLVILTKAAKNRSASLHFVHELTRDGAAPEGLVVRSADEVHAAARETGVEVSGQARIGGMTRLDRRARVAHEKMLARRAAAAALDALDRPGVTPADLDAAADRLRDAAARLAATAALDAGGAAPLWIDPDAARAIAARLTAETVEGGRAFAGPIPFHRLSYSAVDDYERCPRCFYLKHVLGVPEPEQPGMLLGTLAHRALERFYRRWRHAEADGAPAPDLPALVEIARAAFSERDHKHAGADADLLRRLIAQLTLTFEKLHDPAADIADLELDLRFPYEHRGVEYRFEARIDRLDRLPDGGHRIIDYKTGAATGTKLSPSPDDLQLGVYALALRHHQGIPLEDRATPAKGQAEYWILSTGQRGRIDLAQIRYDRIRDRIGRAIDGMLAGAFSRGDGCRGFCDLMGPEA